MYKEKEKNAIFPCKHICFMHQVIGLVFQAEQIRGCQARGRRPARAGSRARTARPPARVAGEEQPSALPGKGLPSLCTPPLLRKQLLLIRSSLLTSRRAFSRPNAGHLRHFFPPRCSSLLPCPTGPGLAFCTNGLLDNLLIQRSNFWMTLSSTINSHAQFGRHFYHQCL